MSESILQQIFKKSIKLQKRIVLPESGTDPRVFHAAFEMAQTGAAVPILVSRGGDVEALAEEEGVALPDNVEIVNQDNEEGRKERISFLEEKLKKKNPTKEQLIQHSMNPLMTAGWLVATGQADGAVAGSIASTADVIRAALRTIGTAENTNLVSSTFLMELTDGRVVTYADCGVVPYPDSKQLANIAVSSGKTHQILTGEEPVIAFLSFSTKGSARHEKVDLVLDALKIAKSAGTGWRMDGDLQFDSAFVPDVAKRKAPDSKVAGKANVFIFPNLDAGNIAYKITERVGGATAIGPILQGLDRPFMDLSRGCSVNDIVYAACICSLLSES